MTQLIGNKEVSAKTGLTVVIASFVSLLLLSKFFSLLSSMGVSPLVTSTGFWLSGGSIAVFVFNRFVIRYLYSADGVKFQVDRVFSKRPRFMEQVLLREFVFVGSLDAAKKKYPGLKVKKAVRKTNPIVPVCAVYKRSGETKGLLLQPNEELLKILQEACKK